MTAPSRTMLALATAATAVAAAGCGGGRPAPGSVAAATAREEVFTAVRSLYEQHLYQARIGYSSSVDGGYEPCPRSGVRFLGGTDLYPFRSQVSLAAYAGALTRALGQAGWAVQRLGPPVRGNGPVSYYAIRKGPLAGDISVVPGPAGPPRATLGLHSGCFRARAQQVLTIRSYHAALPHPTATG